MKTMKQTSITADMTLLDIVEKYPSAKNVFEKYDIKAGECILCYSLFDTLEDVIRKYQLDGKRLLSELNAL